MITTNLDTLRLKSEPFTGTEEELQNLIQVLETDLTNCEMKGVGLSAIQISIPQRVAIIRIGTKYKKRIVWENYDLWNAEIIEKSQQFIFKGEGCLSIPDTFLDTYRFNQIKVKNGDGKIYNFSGHVAVATQHEISHWNGELIFDYAVDKENAEKLLKEIS